METKRLVRGLVISFALMTGFVAPQLVYPCLEPTVRVDQDHSTACVRALISKWRREAEQIKPDLPGFWNAFRRTPVRAELASTICHRAGAPFLTFILTGGSDAPYHMQETQDPRERLPYSTGALRASESAFTELAKLEIQNEVIVNTAYKASGLTMLLAQIGLAIHQRHISSEEERETLNSVFKKIVYFQVKEVTPEAFWEKNLSEFLAKNLSTQEVGEVLKVYPALDQVPAGRKLLRLRPQFVSEVSPLWQEVLKARIQSFKLPSGGGGMIPTLLSGDHIVVDKFAYQFKEPKRGDIIVFRYPEDETKIFIKRIIGVPGDTIEMLNKVVHINGVPLDDRAYTQRIDPGIIDGSINPRDNFGPVTVPEGSYFVMGDNRDQSLDSRFWGYVRTSKIIGRAWMIYWSWGSDGESRWERIGMRLQ